MTDAQPTGLLGDSPQRSYESKLELFNRFAEPELRAVVGWLGVEPGDRVLDAGCGAGLVVSWFAERVGPDGLAVGMDLASAHVEAARAVTQGIETVVLLQGDIAAPPFAGGSFELVWCSNTINHLRDPVAGVRSLAGTLKARGRVVMGQSAFLPDMFFAWDARLEREVREAVYRYYRDKYGLDERDVAGIRNLVGVQQRAGLRVVEAKTTVIERIAPLSATDERYFREAVFGGYWGRKLRPYLSDEDWSTLEQLCDPESPAYCLRRPDFHHVQTFTYVVGERPA